MNNAVSTFDGWTDAFFDKLRGRPVADRVFYGASSLGEHARVWMMISVLRWLRGGRKNRSAGLRCFVTIFLESAIVNLGIKTLVRRSRPDHSGDHPHTLREPWTSSFPSGHASAGFCAATLLVDGDPWLAPAYFGLASVIAASRVHVKMHHGSDVVAGAAIGAVIGMVARKVAPLSREGTLREAGPRRARR